MDVSIRFSRSAFKHNVTEADIRWAFDNILYDEQLDDSDGGEDLGSKHMLIGFNLKGNPIEILYNVIDDDTIRVFHAMGCRNMFLSQIRN